MEYLTTPQAAAKLGLTTGRVRQLAIAGELPGAKRFGRDWMIPKEAVEKSLPRPKPGPTPQGKK